MRATLCVLICTTILLASSVEAAQDAVPWARSIEEAQQIASQRGQLVLLHFYGDNCPPCRALDANVFPKPEFARGLTTNYVPVKINASQNRQLAARYGVDRWPVDVVTTADGKPLTKPTVSPPDANKFLASLDQIAAVHRVRMDPQAQLAQNVAYNQSPNASQYQPTAPAEQGAYGAAPAVANVPNTPAADPRMAPSAPSMQPQQQAYDPRGYQSQNMQGGNYDRRSTFAPAGDTATYADPNASRSMYPNMASQFPAAENPRGMQSESSGAVYGAQSNAYNPSTQPPSQPRTDVRLGDSQYSAGNPAPAPVMQPGIGAGHVAPGTSVYTNSPSAAPSSAGVPPMREAAPTVAAGNPPLGLEGYCPVALTEAAKWTRGDVRYGAIHRGRTYLFATQADQQKFMANPDKYSPMLSGYDPVAYISGGALVDGKRQHGIVHEGQMYLFASEASLDAFCKSPQQFCNPVRQAMQQSVTPNNFR